MATRSGRHRSRVSLRTKLLIGLAFVLAVSSSIIMLLGLRTTFVTFSVAVALFGWTMSSLELRWRMYTRRSPEARKAMAFPPPIPDGTGPSIDLLVPAKNEALVIGATLRALCESTYRAMVYPTLRTGDDDTIRAVEAVQRHHADAIQLVHRAYGDHEAKPAQLNTALAEGTGDIVGIFDAEDTVHPELLGHVAAMFARDPELMVVQAGVQLVNLDVPAPKGSGWFKRLTYRFRGWYAVHNCLEYWFWFSSRMFYQIDQKVVPLGGNTVFVRRSAFDALGGWDGLTEDCDLGIRASKLGMKIAAAYEPRLATREETPHSLIAFFFQRRRWCQGFLEVLQKGDWRKLPTLKQRLIALYILGMPFLQAFYGLLFPISIAASFLMIAPVGLVLLMFIPIMLLVLTLYLQLLALRQFARDFGLRLTGWHYLVLIIGFYPFQLVLATAAIDSIRRWAQGNTHWDSTQHNGFHRAESASELTTEGGVA